MICPCKHCTPETGRSPRCHSICEKYIEWKAEYDKAVDYNRQQYVYNRSIMTFAQRKHWKEWLKKQKGDKV